MEKTNSNELSLFLLLLTVPGWQHCPLCLFVCDVNLKTSYKVKLHKTLIIYEMETNLNLPVDKICRVCLQETSNKKLLTTKTNGDHRTLCEILSFVSNLDIILLDDQIPSAICNICEDILQKADAFKRCCQEAEAIFREILNDSHFANKRASPQLDESTTFTNAVLPAEVKQAPPLQTKNKKVSKIIIKRNNSLENSEFEDSFSVSFDSGSLLSIKQENEETSQPFVASVCQCGDCGAQFNDSTELINHKVLKKCPSLKNEFDIFDTETLDETLNNLNCKSCHSEFNSFEIYKKHKCKKKSKAALKDTNKEIFKCNLCMRSFGAKKNLLRHLKTHEQKGNYHCTICKREFQYQGYLDRHVSSQHPKNRCLPCKLCPKMFDSSEALSLHIQKHSNESKYQCKECSKVFTMGSALKEHMRTHTGEKPFLCTVCGKGFSQKNNLAQHMRRHLGLKPFKCNSCENSFVSKGELDAHARKHSGAHPFVCDLCNNGFTTASSLVKHKRTHTGERPYACDLCPMKFAASGTLKNHRRSHTGEKPYQCSMCDRAFIQRQDLIAHIRCHTGERPYVCTECGQSFRKNNALKIHSRIHLQDPINKIKINGGEAM